MGRYLVKLSLFLGLIIGIGNYLVYLGTGRVPFNDLWQHVKKTPIELPKPSTLDLPSLPTLVGKSGEPSAKAFKWTDKNGVVHYSDQAPDGQQAQLIKVDPNQNLLQGSPAAPVEIEPKKSNAAKNHPAANQTDNAALNPGANLDNPSVQQLLQQIKAATESAKQRPID